jgi:hypothetical protein
MTIGGSEADSTAVTTAGIAAQPTRVPAPGGRGWRTGSARHGVLSGSGGPHREPQSTPATDPLAGPRLVHFPFAGPASAWALTARTGDRATLYGPAASYQPPAGTTWQLIAGDESAPPAIAGIVEHLPGHAAGHVLIEITDDADRQKLDTPPGIGLRWLFRRGGPVRRSGLLAGAIGGVSLPNSGHYVWLTGESSVVTGLRRRLVDDRGLAAVGSRFTGYWRHGNAETTSSVARHRPRRLPLNGETTDDTGRVATGRQPVERERRVP